MNKKVMALCLKVQFFLANPVQKKQTPVSSHIFTSCMSSKCKSKLFIYLSQVH